MSNSRPIAASPMPAGPPASGTARPRILFLIDEMTAITAGGTERQLLQLVNIAQKNGIDPQICVLRGTEWLTSEVAGCPVTHFNIHAIQSAKGLRELNALTRWVREQKFQILQSFFNESNLLAPWIGKFAGVPIVLGSRRNLNHATVDGLRGVASIMQSVSNLLVDGIIANSDAVSEYTQKMEGFAKNKLCVAYNGIELAHLRPTPGARDATRQKLGVKPDELLVGNISGLRAIKGVGIFVEAAAAACKAHPELKFVLVGDGDMRPSIEAAIEEHGLQQCFHLAGAAEDVRSYLAAMDIAVLCSFAEGFSNSLLEYMAAGLPVIATDVGGNREALGDSGLLIRPNDAPALTDAILKLLDPELRRGFGMKAGADVHRFDIHNAETRMGEVYWNYLRSLPLFHASKPEVPGPPFMLLQSDPSVASAGTSSSSVSGLILDRIRSRGDAVAARYEGESLSCKELDRRSAQLAIYLSKLGIGQRQRVGILMDRSTDLPVAMLGVLRSGAAYVPLYQFDPPERLQSLLEDADVSLVLTQDDNQTDVPAQFQSLSLQSSEWQGVSDISALPHEPAPDSIAYLIFTSGSTGKPKGVEVTHGSVVNLLLSMERLIGITPQDRLLAVTTVNFDIAVVELFLPLITGAGLIIASREDAMDGATLSSLVKRHGITIMQATPHSWSAMLDAGFESSPGMKMLCGGEPWTRDLADRLLAGGGRLWNMYGPTETTIWSSASEILKTSGPIALGEPLANTYLYVLDENLRPVAAAASGELYIGGEGVARGYYNRPELTAQRFVADPFRPAGSRMYRTGDIVRRLENGGLQFVGRADNQIKLRGYRIELEEVERAIADSPGIQQCVTRVAQDPRGESRLVAYLKLAAPEKFDPNQLRSALYERLPGYMVPSAFVPVDEFPLTQNLKIDRKSLPEPDWSNFTHLRDARSPDAAGKLASSGTPDVAKMLTVWQEIFPDLAVDPDSNFFDLGGQSLDFARLQTKVLQKFGVQTGVEDLLSAPTVSAIAHRIVESTPTADSRLITIQSGGSHPPLFLISQSLIFRKVARHLGTDQPVFTIQMRDEDIAECAPEPTFSKIAAFYAGIIRKARPHGPYRLGGWCASGWLAFEVAQQLQASGKDVELLVIVDAWAPNYWRDLGPMQRVAAGLNYDISRLRLHLQSVRPHSVDTKARYMLDRLRVRVAGRDRDGEEEFTEVDRLVERAVTAYKPEKFRGKTLLLCSAEQPSGPFIDADMGWGKFLEGTPPQIIRLPGDHRQIFEDPGAAILAAAVEASLYGNTLQTE